MGHGQMIRVERDLGDALGLRRLQQRAGSHYS